MTLSLEAVEDGFCDESCGWIAAAIAALAYGTFGVPIRATKSIDVHPLVMQSYKTFVIFTLGWSVVLLGVEVKFTSWGLLSGLLWVLGGTGGIYGIRKAGLAIAVGTWASIMILVNFLFGIIIFKEPVHDLGGTLSSFALLALGLVGMSRYSAPPPSTDVNDQTQKEEEAELEAQPMTAGRKSYSKRRKITSPDDPNAPNATIFGITLTKRQCGIAGAVLNGVFTGCSLVPLHYAKEEGFGGERYIISIGCGAMISNILIWIIFWLVRSIQVGSIFAAAQTMPESHFSAIWKPGILAGVFLAIAMFGSIISVTYLGQGVGNSLVQAKILVSGLWGILWFQEISGVERVSKWFLSAFVTIGAIVWLSMERLRSTDGADASHYS